MRSEGNIKFTKWGSAQPSGLTQDRHLGHNTFSVKWCFQPISSYKESLWFAVTTRKITAQCTETVSHFIL